MHKSYGSVHAVRGVDLDIPDGEFTVLVGPSGCGKSTLLRTIAGLEDADSGDIAIGGEVVNGMRPRDRDVAMVFQDYALYPHMTVFGNISLSLRARKMPKREIEERVKRAAAMLGVGQLLDRYPRQLSGGQRQRVAIGRAIVRNPRVFLFDEPLSNLDAQLRDEMRGEIKRLHQEISTTMIYVTHDQVEAMTLADRIVLLRDGVIEQQGAPLDLFEQPASLFVAGFLGSPRMNFVSGELRRRAEDASVMLGDGGPELCTSRRSASPTRRDGAKVILGFRPEHVHRSTAARRCRRPRSRRVDDRTCPADRVAQLTQPSGSAGQQAIAELRAHDVNRAGEPDRGRHQPETRRAVRPGLRKGASRFAAMTSDKMSAPPSRAVKLCGTEAIDPPQPPTRLRSARRGTRERPAALRALRRRRNPARHRVSGARRELGHLRAADRKSRNSRRAPKSFAVSYRAVCADARQRLAYEARITGSSDGSLVFDRGRHAGDRLRDQPRWFRRPASGGPRRARS